MNEITIEELAYLLKEGKQNGQPQPIFFLGAGASVSGNIPLANEIEKTIIKEYQDSPFIRKLKASDRTYVNLMECLTPYQRNELLKKYVEKAQINVTHIYLAQLIKNGFADYVLTVNFDNLMLRALALYNEFPAVYDMAILKELTTTTFKEKSIVYLHGQSHGLWLLNTQDEMEKVKNTVPRIFDSIMNKRQWIFIGYSGNDMVFDHLKRIGRFDNGLYWVGYKNNEPEKHVQDFLSAPNVNAYFISGYDSDSFMIKLNEELMLEQPEILDKPFTCLSNMLNNIVDINEEEHFKGVRERLEIAKKRARTAIDQFENNKEISVSSDELKVDRLKKDIINTLISEKYDLSQIEVFESEAKELANIEINSLLSDLYLSWGNNLCENAKNIGSSDGDVLFNEGFLKYQKSVEIKPDNDSAYNNWGNYLAESAKFQKGIEAERLFNEAFLKYQKAIDLQPEKHDVFHNWAADLADFAKTIDGPEGERLFNEAFVKYQKAIETKPDSHETYCNWGNNLGVYATRKKGQEGERLFTEAFLMFQKAIEIKPDSYDAYCNWGNTLGELAKTKEGLERELLFNESFLKYKKAIDIQPEKYNAYHNWGSDLGEYARTKQGLESENLFIEAFSKYKKAINIQPKSKNAYHNWGTDLGEYAKRKQEPESENLFSEAVEKLQRSIELGGGIYNLSCIYANQKMKSLALSNLDRCLSMGEIEVEYVLTDSDWHLYLNDPDFKKLIKKHGKYVG